MTGLLTIDIILQELLPLSEETILALHAGHLADSLVALHIMGWTHKPQGLRSSSQDTVCFTDHWETPDGQTFSTSRSEWESGQVPCNQLPRFSSDTTAAFLMQRKIEELGLRVEFAEAIVGLLPQEGRDLSAWHLTNARPLLRCQAALLAVTMSHDGESL